jgi:hypothetical protein
MWDDDATSDFRAYNPGPNPAPRAGFGRRESRVVSRIRIPTLELEWVWVEHPGNRVGYFPVCRVAISRLR